jgi:hypothetical protein
LAYSGDEVVFHIYTKLWYEQQKAAESNSMGKGVLTNSRERLEAVGRQQAHPTLGEPGQLGPHACEACELMHRDATNTGTPSFEVAALPNVLPRARLL